MMILILHNKLRMNSDKKIQKIQIAQRTKSEHGASTNLSEGSNDTGEDDLKPKPGEKFEFINEKSENWPQWSVNQGQQTAQTVEEPQKQSVVPIKSALDDVYDDEIYFCRGMSSAMRKRLREQRELKKNQPKAEKAPQPAKKGIVDKIKGWFA